MDPRLLITVFALLLALCALPARAQIVVIANVSVKTLDVSSSDLRDVFTGTVSQLKDGSHVTPVLLRPGIVNDSFLSLYVGKSDSAFRANWRSMLFSGQGIMPRTLETETAMVEFVAHTPGAIGYVAKTTPHEGVKTLSVK